jgi:hypothetical protein
MSWTSTYNPNAQPASYEPNYENFDRFVFRFLSDMVSNSIRTIKINNSTPLAFENVLVVDDFSSTILQDQRNITGSKHLLSYSVDPTNPLNYDGNSLSGRTPTTWIAYKIYLTASPQDGNKSAKKKLKLIVATLCQELKADYVYQTTIDGTSYSCHLQQNIINPQDIIILPESINSINYYTATLSILFKITRN